MSTIGKTSPAEARLHAATKLAGAAPHGDDRWQLTSPAPGWFRPLVHHGDLVDAEAAGGAVLGELEVLGKTYRVLAPRGAGVVALHERFAERARAPVGFGDELMILDRSAALATAGGSRGASGTAAAARGLTVRAPSSGRFYGRPSPQKPPFVTVGEVLERGATVCLLEVMKTFHRVTYDDGLLPERARVVAILVAEESDVTAGQALLEVEPA